jgi:hypothetical protein
LHSGRPGSRSSGLRGSGGGLLGLGVPKKLGKPGPNWGDRFSKTLKEQGFELHY